VADLCFIRYFSSEVFLPTTIFFFNLILNFFRVLIVVNVLLSRPRQGVLVQFPKGFQVTVVLNILQWRFPTTRCVNVLQWTFLFLFWVIWFTIVCDLQWIQVGLVIGKGGETIKNMQARSGARIQVCFLNHIFTLFCYIETIFTSFDFIIVLRERCLSWSMLL
jgi:hypothetical protein